MTFCPFDDFFSKPRARSLVKFCSKSAGGTLFAPKPPFLVTSAKDKSTSLAAHYNAYNSYRPHTQKQNHNYPKLSHTKFLLHCLQFSSTPHINAGLWNLPNTRLNRGRLSLCIDETEMTDWGLGDNSFGKP